MATQFFNDSFHNFPRTAIPSKEITVTNTRQTSLSQLKPYLLVFATIAFSLGIWFGLTELNVNARIAFITFGLTILAWSFTKLNDTYVALSGVIVLSLTGVVEPQKFFTSLGDSTIWLMLASFIIAAGVTASGLSNRLTKSIISRVSGINGLFYGLTVILLVTAFIIPATSGRAALMLPVYIAISTTIANRRINISLSLLFPAIILLSAIASLTGADAHLVTAEILSLMGGEKLTFARWMSLGLPFAAVSCLATTFVILWLFLTEGERKGELKINGEILSKNKEVSENWSRQEKFALGVVAALVTLWMTETFHGINSTMIALVGALIVTLPTVGTISFKDGIKQINWNLLLFMAATLEMGEALVESGGAKWLVENSFAAMQNLFANNILAVVAIVAIVSLLSHLVINSRTARSSVLIPMVILLAISMGFNPTALAFISTAAAGFCLTLTVSAKPVMLFSQHDGDTFTQKDLIRLSAVLLPLHLILLIIFAMFIYPLLGLDLTSVTSVSDSLQIR
jgi:anion transporter